MTSKAHRPYAKYGWGWRERRSEPDSRKWVLQKYVSVKVDTYLTSSALDEFIKELQDLSVKEKLDEPVVTFDIEYGTYGDRDRDVLRIEGWRDATEDDVAEAELQLLEHEENRRKHEQRQIDHLRATRPELFK